MSARGNASYYLTHAFLMKSYKETNNTGPEPAHNNYNG